MYTSDDAHLVEIMLFISVGLRVNTSHDLGEIIYCYL